MLSLGFFFDLPTSGISPSGSIIVILPFSLPLPVSILLVIDKLVSKRFGLLLTAARAQKSTKCATKHSAVRVKARIGDTHTSLGGASPALASPAACFSTNSFLVISRISSLSLSHSLPFSSN